MEGEMGEPYKSQIEYLPFLRDAAIEREATDCALIHANEILVIYTKWYSEEGPGRNALV